MLGLNGFDRRQRHSFPLCFRRQVGYRLLLTGLLGQLFLLLFAELLILLPLGRSLLWLHIHDASKIFTRSHALIRRQIDPGAHTFLQARLFVRLHRRIFIGDFHPFPFLDVAHFRPVGRYRRQHSLLHRSQISPRGTGAGNARNCAHCRCGCRCRVRATTAGKSQRRTDQYG